MALFKIFKGLDKDLAAGRPYAKEGNVYFTIDKGQFYIDIAGDGTTTLAVLPKDATETTPANRIPVNAETAKNLLEAGSLSWTDGSESGPVGNLSLGNITTVFDSIPVADDEISGVVNTVDQVFAGEKTFTSSVIIGPKGSNQIAPTNPQALCIGEGNNVASEHGIVVGYDNVLADDDTAVAIGSGNEVSN